MTNNEEKELFDIWLETPLGMDASKGRERFVEYWIGRMNVALATQREEIQERIKNLPISEIYDGNDLKSAEKVYCMSAESWKEIIRYENGRNSFKSDVLDLLQTNQEGIQEGVQEEK